MARNLAGIKPGQSGSTMNFGPAIDLEAIDAMVRNIEIAVMIVAGLLALAWIACEWRDA